jgi:ribosomal protein S18 acetylase RimI-like enzyme
MTSAHPTIEESPLEQHANPMQTSDGYEIHDRPPAVEDYRRLRDVCGLTPRSAAAAKAGLANTVFAVTIRHADQTVGMGRVVGDGALFLQIVDIAVAPEYQGRGLGKMIMAALMKRIEAGVPSEVYVSLMADGDAHHLYAQFGFELVAPRSVGMAVWINKGRSSST